MTGVPSFLAYCDLGSVGPANDWNSRRSIAEELKRRIDQEMLAVALQKGNVLFQAIHTYTDETKHPTSCEANHHTIGCPAHS